MVAEEIEERSAGLDAQGESAAPRPVPRKKLSWTLINFWLDAALLVLFLGLCWTSVVVRFVFPAATQTTGWSLWGLSFMQWLDLQFMLLAGLALAVLVHVMLHWTWVCGVVASHFLSRSGAGRRRNPDDGTRTLWGVGTIIVLLNLLGIALAAAVVMVQSP